MFWTPPTPLTGSHFEKVKLCMDSNLSIYGAHLPLDCHAEIGNNAISGKQTWTGALWKFSAFRRSRCGAAHHQFLRPRTNWVSGLNDLFPRWVSTQWSTGWESPKRLRSLQAPGKVRSIKILAFRGRHPDHRRAQTAPLSMSPRSSNLNLYACGHYATERFGVDALAREDAH